MTRDLVIDDPDVTTSPMLNPFANAKKKGNKGAKTPKNSGLKKKGDPMSKYDNSDNDEDGPDTTFDRRLDNSNLIRIEALSNPKGGGGGAV